MPGDAAQRTEPTSNMTIDARKTYLVQRKGCIIVSYVDQLISAAAYLGTYSEQTCPNVGMKAV